MSARTNTYFLPSYCTQIMCRPARRAGFVFALLFVCLNHAVAQTPPPVSFQAGRDYAAGSHPSSVAVGDFNGDGISDLVVANGNSGNVSVLLGDGDGTFEPPVNYAAGTGPSSVAVGDFNGDRNADLAVANNDGTVSVLLGNGDGTFQTAVNYAAGPNSHLCGCRGLQRGRPCRPCSRESRWHRECAAGQRRRDVSNGSELRRRFKSFFRGSRRL